MSIQVRIHAMDDPFKYGWEAIEINVNNGEYVKKNLHSKDHWDFLDELVEGIIDYLKNSVAKYELKDLSFITKVDREDDCGQLKIKLDAYK